MRIINEKKKKWGQKIYVFYESMMMIFFPSNIYNYCAYMISLAKQINWSNALFGSPFIAEDGKYAKI